MFLKSKFLPAFFSLGLIFACAANLFADTIRLKDGSIIKGKIVTFRDQQFVILIGDGARQRQMAFYAEEIEAIEFDGASPLASNALQVSNQTPVLPRPSASPQNRVNQPTQPTTNANNTANNPNVGNTPLSNTPSENTVANNDVRTGGQTTNPAVNSTPAGAANNPPAANNTTVPVQNNPAANVPVTNTNVPAANNSRPKPIQLSARVLADNTANGWTNTGWVVRKGQKIRISGRGQVNLGGGNFSKPEGIKSLNDSGKLMKTEATGGLIAVIGDDNNDFIFVGGSREFTAARDGALFLGINEGVLDDNSGSFDVTIEIDPAN